MESVVLEISRLLETEPMLVLATKAAILGTELYRDEPKTRFTYCAIFQQFILLLVTYTYFSRVITVAGSSCMTLNCNESFRTFLEGAQHDVLFMSSCYHDRTIFTVH